MDEKKYKLICVRKGKTNYARTNNRKNVTLGSYIYIYTHFQKRFNLNIHTYEICTFSFRIKKVMDDACLYIYI